MSSHHRGHTDRMMKRFPITPALVAEWLVSERLAAERLAGLLLPHQCILCRRFADTTGLCADCWNGLIPISAPVCERCGLPLGHTLADPAPPSTLFCAALQPGGGMGPTFMPPHRTGRIRARHSDQASGNKKSGWAEPSPAPEESCRRVRGTGRPPPSDCRQARAVD